MNYAGIKYCDIANGLGCRTVLFVSGCRNHCKGCFQPQTWEFDYGEPFDEQIQNEILDSLAPAYVQGITLLGGDPFEEENQEALVPFMRRVCNIHTAFHAFSHNTLHLFQLSLPLRHLQAS